MSSQRLMPAAVVVITVSPFLLMLCGCQGGGGEPANPQARPSPSIVAPQEDSDPEAVAIADRVMQALGGREAWDQTRYLSWNFFGRRQHIWDKWTDDVRIEFDDRGGTHTIILMNLRTKSGRVQQGGTEVEDPDGLGAMLENAYQIWINDAYWMFMPFKLRDPGVHLEYGGTQPLADGREADVIVLTFDEVGVTPRNRYDVAVGKDTGLVEEWTFYADRDDDEPKFTLPWAGWKQFSGIKLATDHGRGADWEIAVFDALPAVTFASFAEPPVEGWAEVPGGGS